MKDEIKEILKCIKDKKRDYVGINGCLYQDLDRKELDLLLDYITNLQEENERLLKTQEMYEKKCNKIHQYITQNCEIIRHKDYDEIGKVNGGHVLFLLNGDDK